MAGSRRRCTLTAQGRSGRSDESFADTDHGSIHFQVFVLFLSVKLWSVEGRKMNSILENHDHDAVFLLTQRCHVSKVERRWLIGDWRLLTVDGDEECSLYSIIDDVTKDRR